MATRNLLPTFLLFFTTTLFAQSSSFLHVDQFGYLEDADKVAVITNPQVGYNAASSFTPSSAFELRDATNDAVVFSAAPTIWNNGNTQATSGDKGWWFDFSSITTAGSYYVYDPGNDESSAVFEINNNVYTEVMKAVGRMFFYNRCGHAKNTPYAEPGWTDALAFPQDANCKSIVSPNDASLQKDLSGGWFDAGDYNKYVTFTGPTLHDMLWAYQENNNAFTDDWNIPESGNGIPDIMDEIKWELDWLLKMVNADGSVIIKMGNQNYSENAAAPPSANTADRFYGPTCSSAAISASSALAHAAIAFGEFPSMSAYAQTLEDKAIAAWNHALPFLTSNTLQENCDDGSIVAGNADQNAADQREEALTAAVYLFALIGNSNYNQYIVNQINDATVISNGDWSASNLNIVDALLFYTTLPNADATTSSDIFSSASTSVSNNWNNYYGFDDADLYRAFAPDWTWHWGSNKPKADYGVLNHIITKYGIDSGNSASYEKKSAEQIHYFHGVNPQGMVYLSNMYGLGAEKCANEIYHNWFADGTQWDNAELSTFGPAPGYVPGGPNNNFGGPQNLTPPHNQPSQKSYLDFNTGYPQSSWEITEPAIYYQASFLRLLAIANVELALPVTWLDNPRAELISGDVHIKWFTSAESNNEKFEIEHSLDGKNSYKLGHIKGNGNSTITNSYTFAHQNAPVALNYYRIKQMDYDGKFEYSAVVSIKVEQRVPFTLFPNPAKEQIIIQGEMSDYQVYIFDRDGKRVAAAAFKGNSTTLDVSNFVAGIYSVEVIDWRSKRVEILRFLKL